jgi:hypothetical protein
MASQILIIVSFFMLIIILLLATAKGVSEARTALPWVAGAFVSELAHLARKSAE